MWPTFPIDFGLFIDSLSLEIVYKYLVKFVIVSKHNLQNLHNFVSTVKDTSVGKLLHYLFPSYGLKIDAFEFFDVDIVLDNLDVMEYEIFGIVLMFGILCLFLLIMFLLFSQNLLDLCIRHVILGSKNSTFDWLCNYVSRMTNYFNFHTPLLLS